MNSVKIIDPTSCKIWLPFEGDLINRGNGAYTFTPTGITYASSVLGKAARFNGTSSRIVSNFTRSTETTFKLIVSDMGSPQVPAPHYGLGTIITDSIVDNPNRFILYHFADKHLSFEMWSSAGGYYTIAAPSASVQEIIITIKTGSPGEVKLYTNGVLRGTINPSINVPSNPVWLCAATDGVNPIRFAVCDMSDVQVHNRIWTDKEVAYNYFSKKHLFGG